MNPKEYRLGNLVKDEMDQVCEITQLQNGFKDENEICAWPIDGHPIISRPFKPIELTEEWLIKFGFKKSESCDLFIYLNKNECDTDKLSFKCSEKFACIHVMQYRSLLRHIKYVHQLQNLYFALTEKELELNQ